MKTKTDINSFLLFVIVFSITLLLLSCEKPETVNPPETTAVSIWKIQPVGDSVTQVFRYIVIQQSEGIQNTVEGVADGRCIFIGVKINTTCVVKYLRVQQGQTDGQIEFTPTTTDGQFNTVPAYCYY
jgi:hypothetical protein